MRAAIRISALSQAGFIYVITHDSIGLGKEDGPTHQPIEHLASFCAMPNVLMLCPQMEMKQLVHTRLLSSRGKHPPFLPSLDRSCPNSQELPFKGLKRVATLFKTTLQATTPM